MKYTEIKILHTTSSVRFRMNVLSGYTCLGRAIQLLIVCPLNSLYQLRGR